MGVSRREVITGAAVSAAAATLGVKAGSKKSKKIEDEPVQQGKKKK